MQRPSKPTKIPTTKNMVVDALTTLHSRNGTSLFKIKKYIFDKYLIQATNRRINLIQKCLREYLEAGLVKNTTRKGKGLTGSLRLVKLNANATQIENKSTDFKMIYEKPLHNSTAVTQDVTAEELCQTPSSQNKTLNINARVHSPTKRNPRGRVTDTDTPRSSLTGKGSIRRLSRTLNKTILKA